MLLRCTADNRFIVVFAIAKRRSKRSGGRASVDAGRKRRAHFAEGRNRFVIIAIFFFFFFILSSPARVVSPARRVRLFICSFLIRTTTKKNRIRIPVDRRKRRA